MSQKFLILANPLCPKNTLQASNYFFSTDLIQIKFRCYFCKVYKVAVTQQLKFFYLITIYEKYCNSRKVLCNDIKILLSGVCMSFLLAWFMKKKELPKL